MVCNVFADYWACPAPPIKDSIENNKSTAPKSHYHGISIIMKLPYEYETPKYHDSGLYIYIYIMCIRDTSEGHPWYSMFWAHGPNVGTCGHCSVDDVQLAQVAEAQRGQKHLTSKRLDAPKSRSELRRDCRFHRKRRRIIPKRYLRCLLFGEGAGLS